VRGDDAAALGHAGHFGFLDIVALGQGGASQHFGGGHHPLTADADDEDIGDAISQQSWGGMDPNGLTAVRRRRWWWILDDGVRGAGFDAHVAAGAGVGVNAGETSSLLLPLLAVTVSRRATEIAGQPRSIQLPQPVHWSSMTS
jgi:hypothetical protein